MIRPFLPHFLSPHMQSSAGNSFAECGMFLQVSVYTLFLYPECPFPCTDWLSAAFSLGKGSFGKPSL